MRLSHTISLELIIKDALVQAYPQIKFAIVVRTLANGAYHFSCSQRNLDDIKEKEYVQFLSSSNSGWFAAEETPISFSPAIGQIDLEAELARNCLVVKIKGQNENITALLQFTPFGMTTTHYLSSAEKKVIEQSIKGLLGNFITTYYSDRAIMKQIAHSNDHLHQELSKINAELELKDARFKQAYTQLLNVILLRLEKKLGIQLVSGPEFTQAVIDYEGSFEELEKHLEAQLELEANLALLKSENEIKLNRSHLSDLKPSRPVHNNTGVNINLGRLAKASALLDRYEHAAEKLSGLGLNIIGKNIGAYCDPPISNAAITDSLNKYSKKVFELFEKYPDKWPVIRSEFRSVANLIEKESLRRQTG